jgi:hypothetical protein
MEENRVVIKHDNDEVEVDETVAELAEELMIAGICLIDATGNCGDSDHVWLQLPHTIELEDIFKILFDQGNCETDDLYLRVVEDNLWDYRLFPIHVSQDEKELSPFFFSLSVEFPNSDYCEVLHRVKSHNN